MAENLRINSSFIASSIPDVEMPALEAERRPLNFICIKTVKYTTYIRPHESNALKLNILKSCFNFLVARMVAENFSKLISRFVLASLST